MISKVAERSILGVLILAALIGGIQLYARNRAEIANKEVELTMDGESLQQLTQLSGEPAVVVLRAFYHAGVQSVGVVEDTLPRLSEQGELLWWHTSQVEALRWSNPTLLQKLSRAGWEAGKAVLIFQKAEIFNRAHRNLSLFYGRNVVQSLTLGTLLAILIPDLPEEMFEQVGLGISPALVSWYHRYGFSVIPRLYHHSQLSPPLLRDKVNQLARLGDIKTVIFAGEEALGYPSYLRETAQILKLYGFRFGAVEFLEQKGEETLKKRLAPHVIKVHSITEEEMNRIPMGEATTRWLRAVEERGIRLLYLRPYLNQYTPQTLLRQNIDYVKGITTGIKARQFSIGVAGHPQLGAPAFWKVFCFSLAIFVAVYCLLWLAGIRQEPLWWWGISVVSLAILSAQGLGLMLWWRKGWALLASIAFPTLAMIYPWRHRRALPFAWFLKAFSISICITLYGCLMIAALLSESTFMVGGDQFSGIKFAFVLPLIFVAAHFYFEKMSAVPSQLKKWAGMPITIGLVMTGLFLLGVAGFYVLRSDNFGMLIPLEGKFRAALESFFLVRPRTKEFLIGYPVFFAAYLYLRQGGKKYLWVYWTIAAIGLISLTNSFCHIHTPLFITILRSFYGVCLGTLFGFLLLRVMRSIFAVIHRLYG